MPRASKRRRSEIVDNINDALEIVDDVAEDGDGDLVRAVVAWFALNQISEGNYEDDREGEDGAPEEDEEGPDDEEGDPRDEVEEEPEYDAEEEPDDDVEEEPEDEGEEEPEDEVEEEPEPPRRSRGRSSPRKSS